MYEVTLSKDLFVRLQKLAVPLVDTTVDVIERAVSHYEKNGSEKTSTDTRTGALTTGKPSSVIRAVTISERTPRERGVTIEIDGHAIRAISVKEMYQEALRFLLDNGHSKRLKELVPFSTSTLRYLIADRPVHPNGNDFFVPVKHDGYFMEAHKSYKTGIEHLSQFLAKMGLKLKYVG